MNKDLVAIFEYLDKNNPGNQDIESVLANLKAGKASLAPATATSTPAAPEKAKTPPIKGK